MEKCKLCGRLIDDDVTFKNLFSFHVNFHIKCEDSIKLNNDVEFIPTEFGSISYISKYRNRTVDDLDYFELKSYEFFRKIINENKEYNIYIILTKQVLDLLNYEEIYLLSALSKTRILFVSLLHIDLLEYENLFH